MKNMEIDAGEHCSFSACNRLDFLPFVCDLCQRTFCKDHRVPSSHDCEHITASSVSTIPDKQEFLYPCSLPGCSKHDVTTIQCPECQQCYCITHRHPQGHSCPSLIVTQQPPSTSTASKTYPLKGKTGESATTSKGFKGGSSSKHTSSRVALMRLKMKAVGLDSVPQVERVYFEVQLPEVSGLPNVQLFFSKEWSVGRTVDYIAQKFKLKNDNHKPNSPKLQLYGDKSELPLGMSDKLKTVIETLIPMGIALTLEYDECK